MREDVISEEEISPMKTDTARITKRDVTGFLWKRRDSEKLVGKRDSPHLKAPAILAMARDDGWTERVNDRVPARAA
jgi:hypothetical protein